MARRWRKGDMVRYRVKNSELSQKSWGLTQEHCALKVGEEWTHPDYPHQKPVTVPYGSIGTVVQVSYNGAAIFVMALGVTIHTGMWNPGRWRRVEEAYRDET